jgi:peptidoglycan/xylan/chitin deacetylase (PgdA/CDA1 family)
MADKDIQVCFNVHFDSVSLWLGSFGGEDSPCDISRGVHAGKVGTPRLLDLFDKYGIVTTWNITGHSIESFPRESKMVAEAGHELGLHGYAHENPLAMSKEQEAAVLNKTYDLVVELCGKAPKGYSAPWWELSPNTIDLLLAKGIEYDHSLMENDHSPYYLRRNDKWSKIDYSKPADSWMKPWVPGPLTSLLEIPLQLVSRRRAARHVRQEIPQQPRLGAAARSRARCGPTSSTGSIATWTTASTTPACTPTPRATRRC